MDTLETQWYNLLVKEKGTHSKNNDEFLWLHSFLRHSRANGPGIRAVIWMQGCTLACPGCFNPETHSFTMGKRVKIDDLFTQIRALGDSIEGITLSGGEPLQQVQSVNKLLGMIKRQTSLSVVLFTGYTWKEIQKMNSLEFLQYVDLLLAGRYDQSQRVTRSLIGSPNKTIHFLTDQYTISDVQKVPEAEVAIDSTGKVLVTGINPPKLSS